MASHASILAWRIPWTEEAGGLRSMESQRVGHDWAANTFTFTFHPHDGVFSLPKANFFKVNIHLKFFKANNL